MPSPRGPYSNAMGWRGASGAANPCRSSAWIDRIVPGSGAFADLELKAHVHHRLRDAVAGH